MDYTQVKKTYPRTVHALKSYINTQRAEHIAALVKEGVLSEDTAGEINEEHLEYILEMSFDNSPRGLFDFFDYEGIKITVTPHPDDNNLWLYYSSADKASKTAKSRIEADTSAIEAACILLESKLNV